jgi:hypothetical protein
MNILSNWRIELTTNDVLRALGSSPENARLQKTQILKIAELVIRDSLPLLEPRVIQETYQVKGLIQQKLALKERTTHKSYFLTGSLIAKHLATAEQVIAVVCTIGDKLEKLAAEFMKKDALYGWALDSLGSAAVESLAIQACNQIAARAEAEGMKSSVSLSPGMDGWPVDLGQEELFRLVSPSRIGVSLNSNYQMQPSKSLSLVIGIGHEVMSVGKTCDYCSMSTTCLYQNHYSECKTK